MTQGLQWSELKVVMNARMAEDIVEFPPPAWKVG